MASHSSAGSRATKPGSPCATAASYSSSPIRLPPANAASSTSIDERLWALHQRQRFRDHAGKFRIDQNDLGAAMVELEGDRGRIEPDVQRVEHGAGHRHREMQFVHRGDIRQHRRDRIAMADAAAGEIGRKAPAALIGLRPGEAAAFIDRADVIGIDGGAAREETQRRQRHVIRRRLVQSDAVLVLGCAHRLLSHLAKLTYKNPIEIHGKIATMIRPTISASR